jgi:hypothetical protein
MNASSELSEENPTIPYLAGQAIRRTDGPSLPGRYCPVSHLWVVEEDEGLTPLVRSRESRLGLVTRSRVSPENDDRSFPMSLAAITKTAVQLEGDDEKVRNQRNSLLLASVTKTTVQVEGIDFPVERHRSSPLFELATKTEAKRERDD